MTQRVARSLFAIGGDSCLQGTWMGGGGQGVEFLPADHGHTQITVTQADGELLVGSDSARFPLLLQPALGLSTFSHKEERRGAPWESGSTAWSPLQAGNSFEVPCFIFQLHVNFSLQAIKYPCLL